MLATKYLINKGFYLFQRLGALQKAHPLPAILRKFKPVSMGFLPAPRHPPKRKSSTNTPFL